MSASSKRAGGARDVEAIALFVVFGVVAATVALVNVAVRVGASIDGDDQGVPGNPFTVLTGLADGSVSWPAAATGVLIATVVAVTAVAIAGAVLVRRVRGRRSRVDRAAAKMGRGRDLYSLSARGAGETATRLGVDAPGLELGRAIVGGRSLYAGWEDCAVDVSGPRTGKTTARAIPIILQAPGAVLATSNKRDLVDATRDPRAELGKVWVFDPQAIVDEPPRWWWNPLSYVTDAIKAEILADVFTAANRDPGARTDAYFDKAAQTLLANLLLAAAVAQRSLTQVYLWLSNPTDEEPVDLLRGAEYVLQAHALQAVISAPEKQRGGVYGTAQQIAAFMTNATAMAWVTPPPPGQQRAHFDPQVFVQGTGTLYSLSREGRGSAGALVGALAFAVCEAAEEHAKRSPGGRLAVPLVCALDEVANVCRLRELPALYSHYGSRGICVYAILQNWSQGVGVWGRDGMDTLWSAANIKLYGGGVADPEMLGKLSQLVGDFDLDTRTVSRGKGGRSTSHATRRERIIDVAELASLPRGRALLLASGVPATLIKTVPWMAGPHADAVRASIRAHDPAAASTIAEASQSLHAADVDHATVSA